MKRPGQLLIGLLCAGALSSALAAPGPRSSRAIAKSAKPGRTCTAPTPTAAQCTTEKFMLGPCAKKYAATCKDPIQKKLEKDYQASGATVAPMFELAGNDIPKNLRSGKYHPYLGPKKGRGFGKLSPLGQTAVTAPTKSKIKTSAKLAQRTAPAGRAAELGKARLMKPGAVPKSGKKKQGSAAGTGSVGVFASTGLSGPAHTGLKLAIAEQAHRNPAWDANGQTVGSCEEFAYEEVYDWARFTDAMAACGGDHRCQLDIAFLPDTPGIAGRTLVRKDGKPIKTKGPNPLLYIKKSGTMPKNPMFAVGSKFLYANGVEPMAKSSELEAMGKALNAGMKHYRFGCNGSSCGDTGFADEWDFHQQLYERHRTLAPAVFEEYDRRQAKFAELFLQWAGAAASEEAAMKAQMPVAVHDWIDPLAIVSGDPFESIVAIQAAVNAANVRAPILIKELGNGVMKGMPGAGVNAKPVTGGKVYGALDLLGPWQPDAPAPTVTNLNGLLAAPARPGRTRGRSKAGVSTAPVANNLSPCHPKRFTAIYESLLWGPMSCRLGQFMREEWQRGVDGQKSCLDPDNDDCDWSPRVFQARFIDGLPHLSTQTAYQTECVDYTNDTMPTKRDLKDAEKYIEDMKGAIDEAMDVLGPWEVSPEPETGRKFSFTAGDGDKIGDKDWFAIEHGYEAGWEVQVTEKQGDAVCNIGGGSWAQMKIDAWMVGKSISVIDGMLALDVNRSKKNKGDLDAHLNLLGNDLFNASDKFHLPYDGGVDLGGQDIPKPKPQFSYAIVTGSAWAELVYGAALKATAQTKGDCDLSKLEFGATASMGPTFELNAKAQVGVGVSGVASAGIRGLLNLIELGMPIATSLKVGKEKFAGALQSSLDFDLDLQLTLGTLSGYLALYVEFLMYEEEWELIRWNGVGPATISLLPEPIEVAMPLFGMK